MFIFERAEPYVNVGRKLLYVKKFRFGKPICGTYKKSITGVSFVISNRGEIPQRIVEGDSVCVPFFEIATNPQCSYFCPISSNEIKKSSTKAIKRLEDREIFTDCMAAVRKSQTVSFNRLPALNEVIEHLHFVEDHNVSVENILIHPQEASVFLNSSLFKPYSKWRKKWTSCLGTVRGIKVYQSNQFTPGNILFLAEPKKVGVLQIRSDIKSVRADAPKNLKNGFVVFESIGVCVINDYSLGLIQIVTEQKNEINPEPEMHDEFVAEKIKG